jgi:hypothetical protein
MVNQAGKKTFKVHLDGYNYLPHFKGEAKSPRVYRQALHRLDEAGRL